MRKPFGPSGPGWNPNREPEVEQLTNMTRALSFTSASLARAIRGVEKAGRFVVGVKADGTVIVGDKPVDTTSLVPADAQSSPPPKAVWGRSQWW
jgi:hypothetical protein